MKIKNIIFAFFALFIVFSTTYASNTFTLKVDVLHRLKSNSKGKDVSPVLYKNGIVFSSQKKRHPEKRNRLHTDLFYLPIDENGKEGNAVPFDKTLTTFSHDDAICFSPDKKNIYISRKEFVEDKQSGKTVERLKIVSASYDGRKWGNIKEFPFNNIQEYSVGHPALTKDGKKLYFSSDMPGGYGATDIYVTELVDGEWTTPLNLGVAINTPGREDFPSIDDNGNFYFSSDGHKGYGMLDIYIAKGSPRSYKVINLGAEVNSPSNDFGITTNVEKGYALFSSNRKTGKQEKNDIYFATFSNSLRLTGKVNVENTNEPLAGAELLIFQEGNVVFETVTTKDGWFEYYPSKEGVFHVVAKKEGYANAVVKAKPTAIFSKEEVMVNIRPICFIEGLVTERETGKIVEGAMVDLICNGQLVHTTRTAYNGYYKMKVDAGKDYEIEFWREGYMNKRSDISMVKAKPGITKKNQGLSAIEEGMIFVLNDIHYDLGKWDIRDDVRPTLDRLVKLLKVNPQMSIELSSHTDSRGSARFNLMLSQKRSDSAAKYLAEEGIHASRIIAKGYGEARPVRRCKNGMQFSEMDHQANRRTEVTVLCFDLSAQVTK